MPPGGSRRTPNRPDGSDRFIPSRSGTNFEAARHILQRGGLDGFDDHVSFMSPSQKEFQRQMAMSLYGAEALEKNKIIAYQNKPPVSEVTVTASTLFLRCGMDFIS